MRNSRWAWNSASIFRFLRLNAAKTLNLQFLYSETLYPESVATANGQPTGSFGGTGLDVTFVHRNRDWAYEAFWRRLDGDLRADAGFLPRTDLQSWAGVPPGSWSTTERDNSCEAGDRREMDQRTWAGQ